MEGLITLCMGPVVAIVIEAAKRVPQLPFDGKSKAALIAALVVASFVVRLAIAYVQGGLLAFDFASEVKLVTDSVTAALVAAGSYSLVQKKDPA